MLCRGISVLAIILSVIVISLSGVMMPGPMFAVAVAKSYHSPWAGTKMSIGHAIVEVPLILLIYFGFAQFFQRDAVQIGLSLAGGAVIIWLGINMFRARKDVVSSGKDLKYGAVTVGIVMSAINPLFLLWWATVGSMLVMKFIAFGTVGLPVLIITHWTCDLVWLSFVSVLIYRTKALWGLKLQEWIFAVCSLLLVGFGVWYLISGIQKISL
jgi:threonine/homoserine/homoserine lactone efflux protein